MLQLIFSCYFLFIELFIAIKVNKTISGYFFILTKSTNNYPTMCVDLYIYTPYIIIYEAIVYFSSDKIMGLYPPFFLNHSNIRVKPITILMGSQAATRSVLRPV